ncbi:hypothetical protein QVD17_13876 [Tagetes erecta]|uniref:CW-type domain-containing protein n=1 Tax=Tagetes erecta TaxID=13708 RepID=A0AAD8KWH2_TARER|nr:hypothetical protein QVD17_13876 [Tagetes erecta]
MVNATELEEGEARVDDDGNVDPDTALSYIDDRLQYVLGHFRKDFEHEMSADVLGPKFGGYGSFLPAHKLPPTVHSHKEALNSVKLSSPNGFHLEGVPALLNPVALVDPVKPVALHHKGVSVDQNVLSVNNVASKDTSLFHGETFLSKSEATAGNLVKPTEQRSLKVRIKVGSYKPAIKNDEIYDGLGLLSSPSSTSKNHEGSGDPPVESHDTPLGSPDSILRDMSSIFVPGNRLLSPLNESLICLKNKVMPLITGRTKRLSSVDDSSFVRGEVKQMERKEASSLENNAGFEGDKALYIQKVAETESVDCKPGLINDFKVKVSSDSIASEANRAAKKDVSLKISETKKELIKDQLFGPDITSKESDESYDQKNVKKLSLDSRGIKLIVCKNDPSVTKHDTDRVEKKVGLNKGINCERLQVKISNDMPNQPFERKSKLTGIYRKENLRCSLSGPVKDKKSALRDIVKVRNSYRDILDSDNGSIKVENVERNAIPTEVAVPQQTVVVPAAPPDNWVGCDRCEKWRLLPIGIEPDNLPDKWLCSMSTWLPGRNHCDIGEEETTKAVQDMNFLLISQSQDTLKCNGSMGNIRNPDHKNSTVHSETMANKVGKIKFRPPECTSSSMVGTSQSPMDVQQHNTQKRNSPSETKQLLLEKKGDVKPKKLENMTRSEQYEAVTSKKIKTESEQPNSSSRSHRPQNGLLVSVKTHTENNLMDKRVDIHAKKRKLKDLQESQQIASGLENSETRIKRKEKRLKTELKESSDDKCLNKSKSMKIKLSVSKENSVDTNHEKYQQQGYKITCKKDLGSERFLLAASSSSSLVSSSCKRASLQERRGSPAGSVLSSPTKVLNVDKDSLAVGKTISRKAHVKTEVSRKDIDGSQRIGDKVDLKQKEASKIRHSRNLEHTTDANNALDKYEKSDFQRVKVKVSDPLNGQPNKMRRGEVDVSAKIINDGKIVGKKHAGSEAKITGMGSPEVNQTAKKKLKKVSVGGISKIYHSNEVEQVQSFDHSGQNQSKVMKQLGVAATQNAKRADSATLKNLSVTSFLKEFAYSQSENALTAFRRAEESKDHADHLKISGFDYECNSAYFDSAMKFLCAASLLEACNADISKSNGVDTIDVYTTSVKLFEVCAQEYEKRKEMFASALAYKCLEIACMRIVYCKNLLTRQDLQTSMQMVTQGESPSSSASDVDNLNNQTMDKTMLSKSIANHKNHIVVRNQANLTRLLDLTSDASLAMEASEKSQNAYKCACKNLEEVQNKEMITAVKRAVNFSFQDVKTFVCLVQNARESVNRQGNKRQ